MSQDQVTPDPYQLVWPVTVNTPKETDPVASPRTHNTPVVLPDEVLLRHNARLLDPARAVQPGEKRRIADNARLANPAPAQPIRYAPTAYVADQVLVSTKSTSKADARSVRDLVARLGRTLAAPDPELVRTRIPVRLVPNERDLEMLDRRLATGSHAVVRVQIESSDEFAAPPPDPWQVVQAARDQIGDDELEVSLNHLLFAAPIGGIGISYGHSVGGIGISYGHSVGTSEYAEPGFGGRTPVRLVGRPPARTRVGRRPVVAILDTGVAPHPWFTADETDPIVTRLRYDEESGLVEAADETTGGEPDPNLIDPLEGLIDPLFGHGTFVAGLVRQSCPDARILSVKVMDTDGIVQEAALANSLAYLYERQKSALDAGEAGRDDLVDVVSLSLGYYHESDLAGVAYDTQLKSILQALGELGVLVVAAAGNNATSRRLLPAGFTTFSHGAFPLDDPFTPLVSVGALNPDGGVALFSNEGDWVSCHSPGAALVSTLPIADVGQRSGVDLGTGAVGSRPVGSWRATIDPDSFTGFGTWSGTSFAAPVMAGAAAQALIDGGEPQQVLGGSGTRLQNALRSLGFTLG